MIITRHASQVQQGNLRLFTTSLRVKDLRLPGFYIIDTLDAAGGIGYQRVLNETRAKRLADYLLDAHKALEAFLPTSLFLATDQVLPFDEARSRSIRSLARVSESARLTSLTASIGSAASSSRPRRTGRT